MQGLEHIAINFRAVRIRRTIMNGREYLVAPLTLVVPGVLNGSLGPLFYPPEELERSVLSWNNMPLTLQHPIVNGEPVSARTKEILENSCLGMVLKTGYRNKLVAEGWFDALNTQRIAPDVYNDLVAGRPIELSTGLGTDNEPRQGTYKGRRFTHIARNYRPDHVAILPGKIGACSIADGCGVLINREVNNGPVPLTAAKVITRAAVQGLEAWWGTASIAARRSLLAAAKAGDEFASKHIGAMPTHVLEQIKSIWNVHNELPDGVYTLHGEIIVIKDGKIVQAPQQSMIGKGIGKLASGISTAGSDIIGGGAGGAAAGAVIGAAVGGLVFKSPALAKTLAKGGAWIGGTLGTASGAKTLAGRVYGVNAGQFEEGKHKRDKGKFSTTGGGGASAKPGGGAPDQTASGRDASVVRGIASDPRIKKPRRLRRSNAEVRRRLKGRPPLKDLMTHLKEQKAKGAQVIANPKSAVGRAIADRINNDGVRYLDELEYNVPAGMLAG